MKVTKLIKEYIAEQIENKYRVALDQVTKNYQDTRKQYNNEIKALETETIEKAKAIAVKYDLKYSESSYQPIVKVSNNASNDEKYRQQRDREAELYQKKEAAIRDILVGLELGETTKDELKAAIENVSFEN